MEEIVTTILACSLVYGTVCWFAIQAAYRNGVADGWNAHRRPNDPLYRDINERMGYNGPRSSQSS
jgi:hypothetical protein